MHKIVWFLVKQITPFSLALVFTCPELKTLFTEQAITPLVFYILFEDQGSSREFVLFLFFQEKIYPMTLSVPKTICKKIHAN